MDPNMAPYIYMERNGIHIINLYSKIEEANEALKKIAASGRKNIIRCYQNKQKTSLLKSKSCKHVTSLKDGLVEC
jgi:small subunit ribosomal protein S2